MSTEHRPHHQVTFVVLATGVGAYGVMQSLVLPVLPTLQHALHTSQTTVTWVLTAYLLSASIFTPVMGRIGDMIGKKRVFVLALSALTVGSVVAALATSIGVMIVARAVQGIGGGVLPLAFGIVRDEFPRERVAGAVGSIAALTAVGGGLGIAVAGPIVSVLDYHWLFWLPAILTGAAAIAAQVMVPESPVRTPGRISFLPAALLSLWLVALLVALSEAPDWGWFSGRVIALEALAVVFAVAWVGSEQRAATPLIDMRMMRIPAVATTNVVAFMVGVGMYSVFAFLPEFVQTPSSAGYGFSATVTFSGLLILPSSVTMFVFGQLSGRMARTVGAKAVVVAGSLITAVAMLMLALLHRETGEIFAASALMGVGIGMAFASMSSLIVEAVPAAQTGVASGMNANIRTIGGSVGAAVMSSIVAAGSRAGSLPKEAGYTHGFLMLAGALVLAAGAGVAIPVSRRRSADHRDEIEVGELAMIPGGAVALDARPVSAS